MYLALICLVCLAAGSVLAAAPEAPTCRSLREKDARVRWMSVPMSRIVVNPHGMEPITLPEGLAPCLKTDLAYYSGEFPIKLPCFWAWRLDGEQAADPNAAAGPAADFSREAAGKWSFSRANAEFDGQMHLTIAEANYGSASCELTVDLDKTPYIVLQVGATDGQWALKVNDGTKPVDVALEMGAWGPGTYTYDVRAATGWSGKKTFRVLLFAVGKPGSSTTFAGMRFVGQPEGSPRVVGTSATWSPHALECTAEFTQPQARVESTTFMPDGSTVAQIVRVAEGGPETLILTGQFSQSRVRWDAQHSAVLIEAEDYRARISVGCKARWLGACDSWPGLLASQTQSEVRSGVWAATIDGVKAGDEIVVEAQFAPKGEELPERPSDLSPEGARAALVRREAEWDRLLGLVPRPMDFELRLVDAKGVTADAIRRMYYKAWAFLLQDTLPPMPENGYPYSQVACGKPSLWAEGHPKSRPSAQWESMLGMQFLGLVDSEAAWESYEGMMTLVDKNGMLAGEGLPSRHVQTAWILYELTGDRTRLKNVYPALKRMLEWKISDPRWVYKDAVAPNCKDFEFVVHALIDAGFAIKIADALEMPDEKKLWQQKIKALAADADRWFWDEDGKGPYENYDGNTGRRSAYHGPWNLQALALPSGMLDKAHEQSVIDLFESMLRPNAPFAGTVLCKHPTYQFTMLGAWEHDRPNDAAVMAEAIMREVTMAGEFAECYSFTFPPRTEGVTPSLFGVCNMIDGTLWHNGVILGQGRPVVAHVPGAVGVENLRASGGEGRTSGRSVEARH